MSKIIYYLGAGASYGSKETREYVKDDSNEQILYVHEGLPVVNEIAPALLGFKHSISSTNIDANNSYPFFSYYQEKGSSILSEKAELIRDIDMLYKATVEHATIDTYAKILFLTNRNSEFKKLKNILCTFFVWTQTLNKADRRYDTFLANVLDNRLFLPKDISVISWNYDSQFEKVYRYYSVKKKISIYEKNYEGQIDLSRDDGKIFKVNGSATFSIIAAGRRKRNSR